MLNLIRTETVEKELAEILAYLEEHSGAAAEELADHFESLCSLLCGQPRLGRTRNELRSGIRSRVLGDYVLFYSFDDSNLYVRHLIYGRRDIQSILNEDD